MDTEHPPDQAERIQQYRHEIDDAIQANDQDTLEDYEDRLRDELLDEDLLGAHERYAEEAIYWHQTRDLFDHEEITEAFPDSMEQTRCVYELGEQLMDHGTITSVRNGTDDAKLPYHLLTTEDVLTYAAGQGTELDPDNVQDELEDLRARLPVSQIERRYPGLQDSSI